MEAIPDNCVEAVLAEAAWAREEAVRGVEVLESKALRYTVTFGGAGGVLGIFTAINPPDNIAVAMFALGAAILGLLAGGAAELAVRVRDFPKRPEGAILIDRAALTHPMSLLLASKDLAYQHEWGGIVSNVHRSAIQNHVRETRSLKRVAFEKAAWVNAAEVLFMLAIACLIMALGASAMSLMRGAGHAI